MAKIDASKLNLEDRVVRINRVAKVVKGGRRFSFSSIVVVGDGNGHVGAGIGKAGEVPDSIRKGSEDAKKNLIRVSMVGNTIPHEITADFGASKVLLRPASPGTGVIAGGGVRAVLEAAGVKDVLTKSIGNNNPINTVRATLIALSNLKQMDEEEIRRGKPSKSFGLGPSDEKIVAPKQKLSIFIPQQASAYSGKRDKDGGDRRDRNDRGGDRRGGGGGDRRGGGGDNRGGGGGGNRGGGGGGNFGGGGNRGGGRPGGGGNFGGDNRPPRPDNRPPGDRPGGDRPQGDRPPRPDRPENNQPRPERTERPEPRPEARVEPRVETSAPAPAPERNEEKAE